MSEQSLHAYTVDLLRMFGAPGVIWTHPPNGEYRAKRTAARLKRMGVRAGAPDIILFLPGGRAACLELKTPRGEQSQPQKEWQEDCAANGTPYAIARTPEEVNAILKGWGAVYAPPHRYENRHAA